MYQDLGVVKAIRSLGERIELESFRLPGEYLSEVERLVRKGTRLYTSGNDDNTASYQYNRLGSAAVIEYRDEYPHFPIFERLRSLLLPGAARGGVYLTIHLSPRDPLYGHMVVSYRGIPDSVVSWVLAGLFEIDAAITARFE